jgi:hypothetical protein
VSDLAEFLKKLFDVFTRLENENIDEKMTPAIEDPQVEKMNEISFRNVVMFYMKELMELDNGKKASDYFNDRQRKSLVKSGILLRQYGKGGCRLALSPKTKIVLEQMDDYA